MYKTCPKCGHERTPRATVEAGQCPAGGLFFDKWMSQRFRSPEPEDDARNEVSTLSRCLSFTLLARLTYIEPDLSKTVVIYRTLAWVGLVFWGAWFLSTDHRVLMGGFPEISASLMHRVDLVFHESGHVLFIPLGRFMSVLGGSLGQLLMPLIVAAFFVFKYSNPFGGSVAIWWTGQSLMDLAPYVHDGARQQMILLGGVTGRDRPGYHDWNNILRDLGWLRQAESIAGLVNFAGVVLLLLGLFWGAYLLYRQWRTLS